MGLVVRFKRVNHDNWGEVMEILKTANDWAKAEIFASAFFVLFGLMFIAASIGFWQLGKTEIAKAYIIPTAIAGALLMFVGVGLMISNNIRLGEFPVAYEENISAFVDAEIARADRTFNAFENIVFKVLPTIMLICGVLLIFMTGPVWRAACTSTLIMFAIIMMIDTTASARLKDYKQKLVIASVDLTTNPETTQSE